MQYLVEILEIETFLDAEMGVGIRILNKTNDHLRSITPYWAYVDHAITKFNKGSTVGETQSA